MHKYELDSIMLKGCSCDKLENKKSLFYVLCVGSQQRLTQQYCYWLFSFL